MAASVSGSKTVTKDCSPQLTASSLTTLLGTPIENLTIDQFNQIRDAVRRCPYGREGTKTVGQVLI